MSMDWLGVGWHMLVTVLVQIGSTGLVTDDNREESKPHYASTFQAYVCIRSASIPLAKQVTCPS